MLVEVVSGSDKFLEESEYRDALAIKIDGEVVFEVCDGEPEDSNLSRDFSSCFNITHLMRRAYLAGTLSSDWLVLEKTVDRWEEYDAFKEGG